MESLFPLLPGLEELKGLSDEDLAELLAQHEAATKLIDEDDEEFLAGRTGAEIIVEYEKGVAQIKEIRAEVKERTDAHEAYLAKKEELKAELVEPVEEEVKVEEEGDEPSDENGEDEPAPEEEEEAAPAAEEKVLEPVLASAQEQIVERPRFSRTPPTPAADRFAVTEVKPVGTALVAAGEMALNHPGPLDPTSLAKVMVDAAAHYGPAPKSDKPGTYITEGPLGNVLWDGPRHKTARAEFDFPADRDLDDNVDANSEKIRAVLPSYVNFLGRNGEVGGEALVASGGLCAPLEPFYTMPNFATEAEPVWDALPGFRARRGGVNTPEATTIADITSAISSISEANDALGGTFATKSCQDLTCPAYTEVAVQILAHCREYGNLNARAWPEKIAHENALTMAALSRTSEGFILDRLKALSINVSNGGTGQGALIYTVEAIVRASFGIRGRLRMPREARFRAVMPYWVPDALVLDTVSTQFDRYRDAASVVSYLRSVGIDPVFYLDTPSTGTTQLPDSAQTAAAIDSTPANFQWAFYPEGTFLGIDSGTLELGIVRDSTLNATNDFQVFGERFRNVARIGPAQAAYWITTTYCAAGIFPALGTARTCP